MDKSTSDAGTIAALMIRFQEERIPHAKRLLEKVNNGHTLSDQDIDYLKRVYKDGRQTRSLFGRHPEYHELLSRYVDLYTEIINKALENERA